jgi:hypothetical protein
MPFLHWDFRIVCLLICYVEDLWSIGIVGGLGAAIFLPVSFREIYFARVVPCCVYALPLSPSSCPVERHLSYLPIPESINGTYTRAGSLRNAHYRGQLAHDDNTSTKLSNVEAKWLPLMLRIRETLESNLSSEIGYPDRFSVFCLEFLQAISEILGLPKIRSQPLPSTSFTVHYSIIILSLFSV